MTNRSRLPKLLAALAAASILAAPAASSACPGFVDWVAPIPVDPRIDLVAKAEKSLSQGQTYAAVESAQKAFHRARTRALPAKDPLARRAARVLAVATAREGGAFVGAGYTHLTTEARAEGMRWAISTLRELSKASPKNPGLRTDLAEALSRSDEAKDREEAKKILEDLDKRGTISTAFGHAALAKLRAEKGDGAAAAASAKTCLKMARDLPALCVAPGGEGSS